MYNYDQDEREYEIKKRERWLRNAKRKEAVVEAVGDFFHGVSNVMKRLTHKKTPEEIELEKRELWLSRSRRNEKIKAKLKELFTKKDKEISEETAKDNIPIKDYDLSNFQSLLNEFASKKETEIEPFNIEADDDFDFIKDDDILEDFDDYDDEEVTKFQKIVSKLKENDDESDLDIITENTKIKEEVSKSKEEVKVNRINIDKFKEVLNKGKEFVISQVNPKEEKLKVRNLKIAEVTMGSILTISSSIILARHSLPINGIDFTVIAASLSTGMYSVMHGITKKEEEKPKVKVFKDLYNLGE